MWGEGEGTRVTVHVTGITLASDSLFCIASKHRLFRVTGLSMALIA